MSARERSMAMENNQLNPELLGFTKCLSRRYVGKDGSMERDYIRCSVGKNNKPQMHLSLCDDTANFVRALSGERCDMWINDNGQILLCKGNEFKLSKHKGSWRSTISAASITKQINAMYGDFRRLDLAAKVYAKGNAVLLTPTGERE